MKAGIPLMEPTGGLSPENVREVVKICLDAGCERVIPHVYTSIIHKDSGLTDPQLAKKCFDEIKALF